MELRPYQRQGFADIEAEFTIADIVFFVLATGGGKTVTFTEIIKQYKKRGLQCLLVAHREELITQAHKTLHKNGISSGIIKAEYPMRPEFMVQIGSIQTIAKRKKLITELWPQIDLIVIDEGHHVQDDNTYGALLQLYPMAKVLIVTATPYRLSGKGFTDIYPGKEVKLIINQTNKQLIQDGWLVPFEYHIGWVPDLSGVKIEKGEYNEEQLAKVMDMAPIVQSYFDHCNGKSGICFAVDVAQSISIAQKYNDAGIAAVHVDANTDSDLRRQYFNQFRAKEIKVIINVGILTEGADFPICEFVQMAAPTKSLSKAYQQWGRVTRTLPGIFDNCLTAEARREAIAKSDKPVGIILDNAGIWIEHGFPDDEVDWKMYFNGWVKQKRTKKEEEELMELLLFEIVDPETGEQKKVKTIAETEGMILIKVTKENREAVTGLRHIKKFDAIYEESITNPYAEKPGYNAYFKFRKYCITSRVMITEQIWKHLKANLIDNIEVFVNNYIIQETEKGRKVVPAISSDIAKIRRKGISEGFFKKEYREYKQNIKRFKHKQQMKNRTLLAQVTVLATEMRTLQKEYFKNKSRAVMRESIAKEQELDALLAGIGQIPDLGNCTIKTVTGRFINILRPRSEDIDIVDIITGLSNECRFTGQVRVFYSVAEHCLWMAKRAPAGKKLATLLHECEEPYMKDLAGPQKQIFPDYKFVGKNLQRFIFNHFNIDPALCDDAGIKELDNMALEWEMYNVRDNAYHEEQDKGAIRAKFLLAYEYYKSNNL